MSVMLQLGFTKVSEGLYFEKREMQSADCSEVIHVLNEIEYDKC